MADLTDADLDYLRNINTRPGRGVGQSIDPTRPGPTADRIAELEREITELKAANAAATGWGAAVGARATRIRGLCAELSRLRNEQPKGGDALALEEALRLASRLLLDAETICHAVSNRGQPTYRNMAEAFRQAREQCKAALAAARAKSNK